MVLWTCQKLIYFRRFTITCLTTPRGELKPGDELNQLIKQKGIVRIPRAHNALAELTAKHAGFKSLYLSGGALSVNPGLPDLGMITSDELYLSVRSISRACKIPLIVDGDTGYGETRNVMGLV